MITGFVFVMMLVIEYINILTSGAWQQKLARHKWGQYLIAAFLGVVPGCLGAFMVVAMYSHRVLSMGAVVAAMIATSGDEAFVMLAMIPKQALLLTIALFVIGIAAGAFTDIFRGWQKVLAEEECSGLQVHTVDQCVCFSHGQIIRQWKELSPIRGILAVVLAIFIIAVVSGQVGPPAWNWVKVTIVSVSAFSLFITATVPEHFLEEHLWNHAAKQHLPRIFLWTFGTLLLMHVLTNYLHLESVIRDSRWIMLLIACLMGLIPESGPHLIFVTFYARGTIPLSILLASSIVQDGHGMLPMLAHSRRAFLSIKLINLIVGLLVGATGMALGF
jgi:hypothetical protein